MAGKVNSHISLLRKRTKGRKGGKRMTVKNNLRRSQSSTNYRKAMTSIPKMNTKKNYTKKIKIETLKIAELLKWFIRHETMMMKN